MKSVLITGASGGMGLAACRLFLYSGFRVFGLDIREPDIDSGDFTFIRTDITDMNSVQSAFDAVSRSVSSLRAIIHFSGKYDFNSLIEIPDKELESIFDVNVFGVYRVNKIFLPILEEDGRIVITSSELAPLDPLPFTGLYGITKSALEKYAYSLRMEVGLLSYKVSVIRPGAVSTPMIPNSVSMVNSFCERTELYHANAEKFLQITEKFESKKSPDTVAALSLKAVNSKRPKYVYCVNRNLLLILFNALPDRLQNFIMKKLLSS